MIIDLRVNTKSKEGPSWKGQIKEGPSWKGQNMQRGAFVERSNQRGTFVERSNKYKGPTGRIQWKSRADTRLDVS